MLMDKHIRSVWAPNTKDVIQKKQEEVKKELEKLGMYLTIYPPYRSNFMTGKPVSVNNAKEFFQHELGEFSTQITKQLDQRQPELFRALSEKIQLLLYDSVRQVIVFVLFIMAHYSHFLGTTLQQTRSGI